LKNYINKGIVMSWNELDLETWKILALKDCILTL